MSYSVGCGHTENKKAVDDEAPAIEESVKPEPLEFSPTYYKREITSPENCYYIDSNNTLCGYGYNYYNQLGDYDRETIYIPSEEYKDKIEKNSNPKYEIKTIKIADNVKHISYTGVGGLAYITEDNELYGLGCNYLGNMMNPLISGEFGELISSPKFLLEDVLYAEITSMNAIALKSDGSVWIWGGNLYGELGSILGEDDEKYSLNPIKIMDDAILVSGSGDNFAVIKSDGSLWVWGNNTSGVVDGRNNESILAGHGIEPEIIVPEDMYCKTPQKVMDNVKNVWFGTPDRNTIALGEYKIYAQRIDDSIYFWGGDLGHNPQILKKDTVD